MATVTKKHITLSLSKQLANLKLADREIQAIADRVLVKGMEIGRLGPCPTGICGDYFSPKHPPLDQFKKLPGVVKWEVFPYGIIDWDRFHVRISFDSMEIQRALNAGARF